MAISLKGIEKEVMKERKDINNIEEDLKIMRKRLVEKEPPHFSKRDIINAFFGALIIGLTFVFKGALIDTISRISTYYLALIILSTLIILSVQLYFVEYTKVKDKEHRPIFQFLIKRLATLYLIALIVSVYLIYIFNIDHAIGGFTNVFKLVIVISMPCSIGAAIPSLIKQY